MDTLDYLKEAKPEEAFVDQQVTAFAQMVASTESRLNFQIVNVDNARIQDRRDVEANIFGVLDRVQAQEGEMGIPGVDDVRTRITDFQFVSGVFQYKSETVEYFKGVDYTHTADNGGAWIEPSSQANVQPGVQTGDILYWNSVTGVYDLLAPGTAGQLLQANGAAAPSWVDNLVEAGTITNQSLYWDNAVGRWKAYAIGPSQVYGWLEDEGTVGQVLTSVGTGDPSFQDIPNQLPTPLLASKFLTSNGSSLFWLDPIAVSFEGHGDGYMYFNDTTNIYGTLPYIASTDVVVEGVSGDPRRVLYFNNGTNVQAQSAMIDDLLGDIPDAGTKAVDHVLTLKHDGSSYYAIWNEIDVEAIPAGGSTSYVLQKASGTDYDVEWDVVRTI